MRKVTVVPSGPRMAPMAPSKPRSVTPRSVNGEDRVAGTEACVGGAAIRDDLLDVERITAGAQDGADAGQLEVPVGAGFPRRERDGEGRSVALFWECPERNHTHEVSLLLGLHAVDVGRHVLEREAAVDAAFGLR